MASPVIRTRIAPLALLITFSFVVIGFLKADREMTRAETDRAGLVVSQIATIVEAFLLGHVVELQSIDHLLAYPALSKNSRDNLASDAQQLNQKLATFNAVWLIDSTQVQLLTSQQRNQELIPSQQLVLIAQSRHGDEPSTTIYKKDSQRTLLFVQPLHWPAKATIIASLSSDSLESVLRRQHLSDGFDISITVGSDTVVAQSTVSRRNNARTLRHPITTILPGPWTVVMAYTPSGRAVRITLWVVGLGAIIALGIGLVLERREVSRIADRSSELEHLSTELLRANRAKSEFLANVSHELRTPLNAIVGFVDLLRDGVYGPLNARQAGPVERIEASANHLRHLVDQVLDLAKMAAGRLEVHAEPIELRPFVFDVVSEVEPLMTEKGLSFSLAVGASLPRVRTDPTHLRQILINLLGNAVKFTTDGGISIRGRLVRRNSGNHSSSVQPMITDLAATTSKTERPWIVLQVADSGIGIPEKDRERIFDEFEQVNAGPRGDSIRRGTGLGLSISRRLARLLGGDITVESEMGRGSVFTVWLPVDPADLREDQAA